MELTILEEEKIQTGETQGVENIAYFLHITLRVATVATVTGT